MYFRVQKPLNCIFENTLFLSSLFLSFSFSKDLIHPHSLAIAGDVIPLLLHTENGKNASVTVKKKALPTVIATAIFHGLTATSDGILPMTAGTMAMTCICLWIHKVIFLCFLFFPVLPNMIPMAFYIHFSE